MRCAFIVCTMPSATDALCHHGQHDALRHLLLLCYPITVTFMYYFSAVHSPPSPRVHYLGTAPTVLHHAFTLPFFLSGYSIATGAYLHWQAHLLCIGTHSSTVLPLYFPCLTRAYRTSAARYLVTLGSLSLSLFLSLSLSPLSLSLSLSLSPPPQLGSTPTTSPTVYRTPAGSTLYQCSGASPCSQVPL